MSSVRRVVTGLDDDGRSVILSDSTVRSVPLPENGEAIIAWATEGLAGTTPPDHDPARAMPTVFPAPGGTRFMIITYPPGTGTDETVDLSAEMDGHVHVDARGFHATRTVDVAIVLSGQVWLELDAGTEVVLSPGEVLVQHATRHGWRNRGSEPAVMFVVLLGATES